MAMLSLYTGESRRTASTKHQNKQGSKNSTINLKYDDKVNKSLIIRRDFNNLFVRAVIMQVTNFYSEEKSWTE